MASDYVREVGEGPALTPTKWTHPMPHTDSSVWTLLERVLATPVERWLSAAPQGTADLITSLEAAAGRRSGVLGLRRSGSTSIPSRRARMGGLE